jgi:hypothetical protein
MAVQKLKIYKSPGIDRIQAELIKPDVRKTRTEILQLVTSIGNNDDLL